jgi:hypothetical protein
VVVVSFFFFFCISELHWRNRRACLMRYNTSNARLSFSPTTMFARRAASASGSCRPWREKLVKPMKLNCANIMVFAVRNTMATKAQTSSHMNRDFVRRREKTRRTIETMAATTRNCDVVIIMLVRPNIVVEKKLGIPLMLPLPGSVLLDEVVEFMTFFFFLVRRIFGIVEFVFLRF